MNRLHSILSLLLLFFVTATTSFAQKTKEYINPAARYEHAKMLYIKKLYVPAIHEFEQFLESKPGPNFNYEARAYIGLARLKLDKQNSSRDLSKLIRNEPEHKLNTEITYELGIHYFNKGKYTRALKYLEKINETDVSKQQREELAFKQGYSYFKNREYEKAKNQFKKVMNGGGKYAIEANYYYGYQCYILKDYSCAIATFEKIGNKGPKTMQL